MIPTFSDVIDDFVECLQGNMPVEELVDILCASLSPGEAILASAIKPALIARLANILRATESLVARMPEGKDAAMQFLRDVANQMRVSGKVIMSELYDRSRERFASWTFLPNVVYILYIFPEPAEEGAFS